MNKLIIAFLFCFGFVDLLWAQNEKTLKGIVVETNPKGLIEPIQGALVFWLGSGNIVVTDSAGVFKIKLEPDKQRLVVLALGYKPDTILVAGKSNVKVLLLNKNHLKELVVSHERKSSEISFIDPWKTTIMNEKELFKAACCNLSESFETNPSVDVSYADALTGTKQIQLLGLAGQYTQISQEGMPGIRGIATNFGLAYTPGSWVNAIQVSKGVGSVVNGFESISGLINVELHKPNAKDKLFLNAYASEGGRYEANLVFRQQLNDKFSQALFLHGSILTQEIDRNKDGFMDNPLGHQFNVLYRFAFDNKKGWITQGGVQALLDDKTGGQLGFRTGINDTAIQQLYGTRINAQRVNGFFKSSYVFPQQRYKSIGLQVSGSNQQYDNYFGKNLYKATQQSTYTNLIFQSIIGNSDHKYRTGLSQQMDWVDESLFNVNAYSFKRQEIVSGAFIEYTFSYKYNFNIVAGLRCDYHNYFGWQTTPRLHMRYAPSMQTVIRASIGSGWRTANVIAENLGTLTSSRIWNFQQAFTKNTVYGFKPEKAWNAGLNLTHDFTLNYRKGTLGIDYYYTQFENQVIADRDANAQQVLFYHLNGNSYSNSIQIQLDYQPIRRFDVKIAYRWYEVKMQYLQGMLQVPLNAKQRAFINVSYLTKNKWAFDLTTQWLGEKRLPITLSNPETYRLPEYSKPYFLVNAQITKSLKKKWDIYLGVENLLDFKQENPIIDAQHPFGNYFDASMIWGPVFGRMTYGGIRFKM